MPRRRGEVPNQRAAATTTSVVREMSDESEVSEEEAERAATATASSEAPPPDTFVRERTQWGIHCQLHGTCIPWRLFPCLREVPLR
ncbi:unnamed protein product [Heligmosomoides polygyrus]|uniref:Uncharacterized protein n=1 Tax=Heligmosomoides polygyrus TaxID=6339 RepID=A0A183FGD4_HELPZ|nr:unnamed protein product [Heligmosomoides polygyrus]